MIKKNRIKPSLDSRKKPHVHDWYLWGTSTNMIPNEKEISLGVINAEVFCSVPMTFSQCRWLTNWLGRCPAGSVHPRTEEMVKDMKTNGSLGCNDYETIKFKLLKKITKKSRRIINNGIKPLYSTRTDVQLSRDLLSRIPLPKSLESRGPEMLLDFQRKLPLCI